MLTTTLARASSRAKRTWRSALAVTLCGLLACSAVQAAGNNGRRTIVALTIHDTGHVFVELSADGDQVESCTSAGSQRLEVLDKNDPRFKNMYAMLLTAYTSKTPIQGWVNGCIDVWGTGTLVVPRILTLALVP